MGTYHITNNEGLQNSVKEPYNNKLKRQTRRAQESMRI